MLSWVEREEKARTESFSYYSKQCVYQGEFSFPLPGILESWPTKRAARSLFGCERDSYGRVKSGQNCFDGIHIAGSEGSSQWYFTLEEIYRGARGDNSIYAHVKTS